MRLHRVGHDWNDLAATAAGAIKIMLKVLQARLQQYMKWELPDVQTGFRKGRGTRDQIVNTCWIIRKAREFHRNIYFCFIQYSKAFNSEDHSKFWKILQEMGIPDHLTCLLETWMQVKKQQLELDMGQQIGSKLGKKCFKAEYYPPVYLTEHSMQNGWSTSWTQDYQEKYQ